MLHEITKPTIIDTVHEATAFSHVPAATGRAGSVRLVPPGVDSPDKRTSVEDAPSLTNIVVDTLTQNNSIKQLELLSFSGEQFQEHVLTPMVQSEQPAVRDDPLPTVAQTLADATVNGRLGTAQSSIVEACNRHLPPEYGIETAAVDFTPLGHTPVPACRLLIKDRHDHVPRTVMQREPLPTAIRELARLGQPHMVQTLIQRNAGSGPEFLVSHRCAVFDPDQIATTHEDYLELLDHGRQYNLSDIWPDVAYTTNYDFPIEDFVKRTFRKVLLDEAKYREKSDSRTAWELFEGLQEYRYLLAAQMGADELYSDTVGYPRFPASDADLRRFAAAVTLYYDRDIWNGAYGRRPPRITTDTVIAAAPGTDQSAGTGSFAVPDDDPNAVVNTGTPSHINLLSFSIQALTEEGFDAEEVTQDSDSKPDGHLTTDAGETTNIEAEVGDLSKPANLAINNARAKHEDRSVMHVTTDLTDAERVHDVLAEPFKRTADDGAILYNWSTAVEHADGTIPLLPDGTIESTWKLTVDGTVTLLADDDELATGPADAPLADYEFDCPTYDQQDDTHCIVSPDGTVLDTAPTRSGILEHWTQVRIPLVPPNLHFLADSEIRFKSGDTLEQHDDTPTWMRTADSKRDIYEGAVSEFLQTFTIGLEGAELRYDEFRDVFDDWYRARLDLDDDPTNEPAIPKVEIGKALPDYVETKSRDEDGKQRRFLRDRTLVFPRGLQSPELPFRTDNED